MVAQGAHAASAFLIEKLKIHQIPTNWTLIEQKWLRTGTTKICVRVESESELLDLHEKASLAGLSSYLITDAGKTEFKEPTKTCLAIGPARSSDLDPITGHLKLL